MPELPEVEIAARRLDAALRGATVESALAPGMNGMKTFEPPRTELARREGTGGAGGGAARSDGGIGSGAGNERDEDVRAAAERAGRARGDRGAARREDAR